MSFGRLGSLGSGFGRLGAGTRKASSLLAASAAPTLTLVSGANVNLPLFNLTPAGSEQFLVGDIVTFWRRLNGGTAESTPNTIDSGEFDDQELNFSTGPLADGDWEFWATHGRPGHLTSNPSNIEEETIDATAPTITSASTANVAENTTAVLTVTATDGGSGLTATPYSITGGADQAKFTINATSGALVFASAPDFETPTDVGANNVYNVIVGATDVAGNTGTMAIAVTVTDVVEAGNVLIDLASITTQSGASVTTATFAIDVGSGPNGTANLALVVAAQFVNGTGVVSGVTAAFDGAPMSARGNIGNTTSGDIYLFGLTNPSVGTHNLVINWTGANQVVVSEQSVVGADQTGGATTFHNVASNTGNTSPNSVAITAGAGEMIFAAHVIDGNFAAQGGGTDIGHNNGGNVDSAAANYDTGSDTLTYSSGGAGNWASIGCAIKAA